MLCYNIIRGGVMHLSFVVITYSSYISSMPRYPLVNLPSQVVNISALKLATWISWWGMSANSAVSFYILCFNLWQGCFVLRRSIQPPYTRYTFSQFPGWFTLPQRINSAVRLTVDHNERLTVKPNNRPSRRLWAINVGCLNVRRTTLGI